MLNKYEYVIKTCDFIEKSLGNRYPFITRYESFNDKLAQLRNRIPSYIMTHLHTIRQQRNYLAHNQEYRFHWDSYDCALCFVFKWLGVTFPDAPPVPVQKVIRKETVVIEKEPSAQARDVLLATGAGLAGLGLAGLLMGDRKGRF